MSDVTVPSTAAPMTVVSRPPAAPSATVRPVEAPDRAPIGTAAAATVDTATQHEPDAPTDDDDASPAEIVHILPWPDPVIDRLGYDPRSLYVETFWLGIIGPTSTWLMRRIAIGFDEQPAGFDLDTSETARALGLGDRAGRNSPFRRAMSRCVTFQVARRVGLDSLGVRRRLPPLPRRHLLHLPISLQEEHRRWIAPVRRSPVLDDARRQARRLALGLLASGEQRDTFEAQLVRLRVHPALAAEATQWAHALQGETAPTAGPGRTA